VFEIHGGESMNRTKDFERKIRENEIRIGIYGNLAMQMKAEMRILQSENEVFTELIKCDKE